MAVVVQMVTHDRVGSQTFPVEVRLPLSQSSILAAASKKFKTVSKQSRVYLGTTGAELQGPVAPDDLQNTFVVLGPKTGWKGAARLADHQETAKVEEALLPSEDDEDPDAAATCEATKESLLEAARSERSGGVVLFWKETQPNGYLSNWATSRFIIDDVGYNCAEQWIMACKARVCGDAEIEAQIMKASSPRKQKGLGRSLDRKTVSRCWRSPQKWQSQVMAMRAKFSQHPALAMRLLRTGHKPIAEASPSDAIFGIGLAPSDPLAQDPANWKGTNLLGKALMQVREELRARVLSHGDVALDIHATEHEESRPSDAAEGGANGSASDQEEEDEQLSEEKDDDEDDDWEIVSPGGEASDKRPP